MIVLSLDTCLGACSAAILQGDTLAASRCELMQRGHAEAIGPMVQAVIADSGVEKTALARIAVTIGPGSFTGVRIGLSLAQGLGLGLGIPVIGIDTMTATSAPVLGREAVTVCHSAGATGQFYVQHFSAKGLAQGHIQLLTADDMRPVQGQLVIGSGAAQIAGGRRDAGLDMPDAKHFAALAQTLPVGAMPQPLYIRAADAKPQTPPLPEDGSALIVVATTEWAPLLARLHAKCFLEGWSASDITAMLGIAGTQALAITTGDVVSGFILKRSIAGEAEILTLCTNPAMRRHGHARRLLREAIARLRHDGVQALFLDVAADNDAALSLYKAEGFSQTGRRKNYYNRRSGHCDALLLRLQLS